MNNWHGYYFVDNKNINKNKLVLIHIYKPDVAGNFIKAFIRNMVHFHCKMRVKIKVEQIGAPL